jgi:hypothetical protein
MLLTVTKAFFYAVHEGILGARDYEVDLKKYEDKGDMRQRGCTWFSTAYWTSSV